MKQPPKDMGTSVRARLLNLAAARGEDFQLVLTRYANERLLHRLARSRHGGRFVLKGATLFTLWTGEPHRVTRDVDLLGFGDPSEAHIRSVFAEVLAVDVDDDGVRFDASSLEVGAIRQGQAYRGVRVLVVARVTTARVRLQVDVGFGDAITPQPVPVDLPALLDFEAPRLLAYPRETVIAEKLEAMVQRGLANSRMKDFYDLAVLARTFAFEGEVLARAIGATFERRGTPCPRRRRSRSRRSSPRMGRRASSGARRAQVGRRGRGEPGRGRRRVRAVPASGASLPNPGHELNAWRTVSMGRNIRLGQPAVSSNWSRASRPMRATGMGYLGSFAATAQDTSDDSTDAMLKV